MSEFERIACRILGIILFVLVIVTWFQISGCTCSEVPPPPIEPEYIDGVKMENYA